MTIIPKRRWFRLGFALWGVFVTGLVAGMLAGYAAAYPSALSLFVVRAAIVLTITWGLVVAVVVLKKRRGKSDVKVFPE